MEATVAPAPRHWRKPVCSSRGPSQPKINKQINSRENHVMFWVVYHRGWILGGSFHSFLVMDAGRVDVCSCLMPPFHSGSAWGLVRYPQNTFLVLVLLLFPHQACTGVFSIEAVFMFQPRISPWTLRWPSVCVESEEAGGKAGHGALGMSPSSLYGRHVAAQRLLAESKCLESPCCRRGLLCSPPWIEVGTEVFLSCCSCVTMNLWGVACHHLFSHYPYYS